MVVTRKDAVAIRQRILLTDAARTHITTAIGRID
jgi:hypothetical protein